MIARIPFTMRAAPFIALGLLLLGNGCRKRDAEIANGDDPLKSLTVRRLSDRYGTTYWTQQSIADTAFWAQAVAYCEGKIEGNHPNCDVVRQVRGLELMSQMPPDRRRDFNLTIPEAERPHAMAH